MSAAATANRKSLTSCSWAGENMPANLAAGFVLSSCKAVTALANDGLPSHAVSAPSFCGSGGVVGGGRSGGAPSRLGLVLGLGLAFKVAQHRGQFGLARGLVGLERGQHDLVNDRAGALVGLWLTLAEGGHCFFVPRLDAVLVKLHQLHEGCVRVIAKAPPADADLDHALGFARSQPRLGRMLGQFLDDCR